MRYRQVARLDIATGEITVEIAEAPPALDFGERVAGLKASLPGPGPGDTCLAALRCNGCGAEQVLDYGTPVYPLGWRELEDGDFCPDCLAGNVN